LDPSFVPSTALASEPFALTTVIPYGALHIRNDVVVPFVLTTVIPYGALRIRNDVLVPYDGTHNDVLVPYDGTHIRNGVAVQQFVDMALASVLASVLALALASAVDMVRKQVVDILFAVE